jgi:hypothetical protein
MASDRYGLDKLGEDGIPIRRLLDGGVPVALSTDGVPYSMLWTAWQAIARWDEESGLPKYLLSTNLCLRFDRNFTFLRNSWLKPMGYDDYGRGGHGKLLSTSNETEYLAAVSRFEAGGLIDDRVVAVALSVNVMNERARLLSVVRVLFEFSRTGNVMNSVLIASIRGHQFDPHNFVEWLEIVLGLLLYSMVHSLRPRTQSAHGTGARVEPAYGLGLRYDARSDARTSAHSLRATCTAARAQVLYYAVAMLVEWARVGRLWLSDVFNLCEVLIIGNMLTFAVLYSRLVAKHNLVIREELWRTTDIAVCVRALYLASAWACLASLLAPSCRPAIHPAACPLIPGRARAGAWPPERCACPPPSLLASPALRTWL